MLPYLKEVQNPSKKYTVLFKGINYGEGTQDGEFAETYNLSTDQYPCITQRATRELVREYAKPTTLHGKGELLVIDGTDVYYGGEKVGEVTEGKKQTATVGNYIVIFPDKKYYKVPTEDENGEKVEGEFGSMDIVVNETGLRFSASTITKVTDVHLSTHVECRGIAWHDAHDGVEHADGGIILLEVGIAESEVVPQTLILGGMAQGVAVVANGLGILALVDTCKSA